MLDTIPYPASKLSRGTRHRQVFSACLFFAWDGGGMQTTPT